MGNREKWRKVVAKSSVVPQRPSRLRDDLTPNHSEMISKLADAHINAETVKQRHTDAHINAETVKQMHADAHINAATVKHSLKSSKETAKQAS